MATRVPGGLSRLAWPAVALGLGLPALLWLDAGDPRAHAWAFRPVQGWSGGDVLRTAWICAWVHVNDRHAVWNIGGACALGVLGVRLRLGPRAALAWLVSWPLTHLLLLTAPQLQWYVGASGVLHAGLAVLAVEGLAQPEGRWMAGLLLLGLLLKVYLDVTSGFPLAWRPDLGMAVVTLSHLSGTLCGLFLAGFLRARFP